MRIAVMATTLLVSTLAHAQPGAAPPPAPPATYPPPAPTGYPPPPYQYQPGYGYPAQLTPEEHELLMEGEISEGEQFGGGIVALFVGFGSGQAIQGRWSDTGWIFTLGETASFVAMMSGAFRLAEDCTNDFGEDRDCDHSDGPALMVIGALGLTVFRIWGTIDAFSGPNAHNRRVRELRWRMGVPVQVGWKPYLNRTKDGGATAGFTLSF
jgi:hypothetical protein